MWTAPNDCIERPQIWDLLSHQQAGPDLGRLVSAAQQGLRGRLRLHARPDPQSRRLRIALVLHAADRSCTARCATRLGHFPLMHFWGPMANIKSTRVDRRLGRDRRAAVAARLLLHLSAAPRLRRAADRPGQRRRPTRPWPSWTKCIGRLADGMARGLRRRPALARGRRIRDHAGRSRDAIRTACCARPACWRCAKTDDGEQLDFEAQPGLGDGRSPVLARLRGRRRPSDGRARGRPLPRPAGHRRSARRHAARPLRTSTIRAAAR